MRFIKRTYKKPVGKKKQQMYDRSMRLRLHRGIKSKWNVTRAFKFKRNVGWDASITPSDGQVFFTNASDLDSGTFNTPFAFNQLPNYTEFSYLFDQYKIVGVRMTFIYSNNVSNLSSNTAVGSALANSGLPVLYWVYDSDDATPLANLNAMREYESYTARRLDRPVKIFVRPKHLTNIYVSAGVDAQAPDKQKWLDINQTSIPHYGVKFCLDPLIANQTSEIGLLRCEMKYYVLCRGVR